MVDIHSHVLPGVDDGAASLDDSVAMLNMAADAGTTDIVATSHANTEFAWNQQVIEQRFAEVKAAIGTRIRVHPGCELHLTFDNINDAIKNPRKYTINHKHWLLIEFSDLIIFQNVDSILEALGGAGMNLIVAHPERNQILQQRMETLEKWSRFGVCYQVTAQSLTGTFGSVTRKFSEKLIERGMVQFVASDAHDMDYRVPRLDGARKWLADRYGEEYADAVTLHNPGAAVLGGDIVETMPPKRKKWLGLFG
jgi:protein-tyrosine phosphatase